MKITAKVVAQRAAVVWAIGSSLYSAERCEEWPYEVCLTRDRGVKDPCPACSKRKELIVKLRSAKRSFQRAARSYAMRHDIGIDGPTGETP